MKLRLTIGWLAIDDWRLTIDGWGLTIDNCQWKRSTTLKIIGGEKTKQTITFERAKQKAKYRELINNPRKFLFQIERSNCWREVWIRKLFGRNNTIFLVAVESGWRLNWFWRVYRMRMRMRMSGEWWVVSDVESRGELIWVKVRRRGMYSQWVGEWVSGWEGESVGGWGVKEEEGGWWILRYWMKW